MTNQGGIKTLPAGEALAAARRVKMSSGTWVYADADAPGNGVTLEAAKSGEDVAVHLFGAAPGTVEIEASEAIASQNTDVYAALDGKIQNLPAGAGTYYKVGATLDTATAAGDIIEVQPMGAGIATVV